jgi:phosphohistidine phosphatase
LRIVFLVRHAKSSWKDTSLHDRDRPLKKRGTRDLELLKPVLLDHRHRPQHIFSSDAVRAAETANILAGFYGLKKKDLTLSRELYASSGGEIIGYIRDRVGGPGSIMLVGHNPGITECADLLGEKTACDWLPTSAVVCFAFDLDRWERLKEHSGRLEFYEYPGKYRQGGSG